MWMNVIVWGILLSNLFTSVFSVLKFVFLRTLLSTTLLNFFGTTEVVFSLLTSKVCTFVFKLFKLIFYLLFLKQYFLAAKSDVSTTAACF